MEFSTEKPPNWDKLVELYNAEWGPTVVTYGDTIYSAHELSPDLIAHERVHVEQQTKMGAEMWWDMFYQSPQFRLEQELEAYRAQYRFLKTQTKNRNLLAQKLAKIATDLSSYRYGNIISYPQALAAIKQ